MKMFLNFKTALFLFSLMIASSVFSHNGKDPIITDDQISVVANSSTGVAKINWKDNRIETIEIVSSNGQFMPMIPVMGASELHLNDLIDGIYTINFKSNEGTLYTKIIEIKR